MPTLCEPTMEYPRTTQLGCLVYPCVVQNKTGWWVVDEHRSHAAGDAKTAMTGREELTRCIHFTFYVLDA